MYTNTEINALIAEWISENFVSECIKIEECNLFPFGKKVVDINDDEMVVFFDYLTSSIMYCYPNSDKNTSRIVEKKEGGIKLNFDSLKNQELEKVKKVMMECSQVGMQFSEKMNLIKKLAPEASKNMNYIFELHCLFNSGRVFERMEKALEVEHDEMFLETSTDTFMEILVNKKNASGKTLADALYEHVSSITEESFRYGYYAALKYENVKF